MFNIFAAPLLLYLIIGLISSTDAVPRKRYLCQTDYAEHYEGSVYCCCYVGHSSSLQLNLTSLITSFSVMLYPPHIYPREFPYPLRGNKLFYNVCKKLKVPLCLYFFRICNRYMGLVLYYSFLSRYPSLSNNSALSKMFPTTSYSVSYSSLCL